MVLMLLIKVTQNHDPHFDCHMTAMWSIISCSVIRSGETHFFLCQFCVLIAVVVT